MPAGTVKIYLIGATAIKDTEWIGKGDPYAVIEYGQQHVRSNTASNQGAKPNWNQKLHFYIDDFVTDILIKIYNENHLSTDDVIGTITIPLANAFAEKKMAPRSYSLEPKGDIKLRISYAPKVKPAIRRTATFPGPYSPATHSSPYVTGSAKSLDEFYTGPYGISS